MNDPNEDTVVPMIFEMLDALDKRMKNIEDLLRDRGIPITPSIPIRDFSFPDSLNMDTYEYPDVYDPIGE